MSRKVVVDLDDTDWGGHDVNNLDDPDFNYVAIGIEPSGHLHLGFALVASLAMRVLDYNPGATLDACITDLDFDEQRPRSFPSYFAIPDSDGCHTLFKEHVFDETQRVLHEMADYRGIDRERIRLSYFSDLLKDEIFQKLILELFGTDQGRSLLKSTIIADPDNKKSAKLLAPVCEECGYASTVPPKYVKTESGLWLRTQCFNDDCDVGEYMVDIIDPGRVLFNYMLDAIRDRIPNADGNLIDCHIFGGDYNVPWGVSGHSKGARVIALNMVLSPADSYSIYVGPIIKFNGQKVSKSEGTNLTVNLMREEFPDWVDRLERMLDKHYDSNLFDLAYLPEFFPFSGSMQES